MKIGEALVRPGQLTRRDAFNRAASNAYKIILVGVNYGIFMLLLLSGKLWPQRRFTTE